jgi:mono/diheme cytochrome c family protein
MGSPYYNQEMEQRHRQQLQEMGQSLNAMQRQRTGTAGTSRLGADLFARNCAGCHPHGGNTINPDLPLKGSPQLADFKAFLTFIRYPHLPGGAPGAMPRFSSARLSDQQARELYQYLTSLWGK